MLPFEYDDWREIILRCGDCVYHDLIADMFPEQSTCLNIDYTNHWIYAPWFVAHNTGEHIHICRHFRPRKHMKYVNEHFIDADDYLSYQIMHGYLDFHKAKIVFYLAKNKTKSYAVWYRDFYYGTYVNNDRTLKAHTIQYYKREKDSPTGHKLITEEMDIPLVIEKKTFLDILQESVDRK